MTLMTIVEARPIVGPAPARRAGLLCFHHDATPLITLSGGYLRTTQGGPWADVRAVRCWLAGCGGTLHRHPDNEDKTKMETASGGFALVLVLLGCLEKNVVNNARVCETMK